MMKKSKLRMSGADRMWKQNFKPGMKSCSVERSVNHLFAVVALAVLALSTLLLSGCAEAGGEELLTDASDEFTSQVTETMEEIELTEEEAEQDHLFLQVTSNVTVDADITPRSLYSEGLGMWQQRTESDEEISEMLSYEELKEGQDTLGESLTLEDVDSALSDMAETFGTVWQEVYGEAKSRSTVESSDTFWYRDSDGLLEINTPGATTPESAYEGSASTEIYSVTEDLDFLPAETVRQAATLMYQKIWPDMGVSLLFQSNTLEQQQRAVELTNASTYGANYELNENAKEYYYLEFYETIDGIPIKRTMLPWKVLANSLAEGSYYYDAWWASQGISYAMSSDSIVGFMKVTESGFYLWICLKSTGYEQLREAQKVVDINEILNSACESLVSLGETITVGSVELVMAQTTIEDEEGTWLVYAPFWTVDYYRFKKVGVENFYKRYQMVFDGYTGELLNDDEYR
ncbi:MAG: hypothetical protein LUE29_14050 [Lachnospiraceae bacterium]|nr:hypothetical protein [Lachnospiraceae bacterium]